jgi:hypothetical protein
MISSVAMTVSARKIGGALVILLILLLHASAAFHVLASGSGRSAAGDLSVTILTVLFAAGAMAPFINLFAIRRGLYATATLLLIVIAAGSLCILWVTLRQPSGAAAAGLHAASCFWLILASGLLLVFPLSCTGRGPDEEVLSRPVVSVSLLYTALLSSCAAALIVFSGTSQACGRLVSRMPALGLVLSAAGLILVIRRCRSSSQGPLSLLCLSLAPALMLAAFCLMPCGNGHLMPACRAMSHVFWAAAGGCALALATAGRRTFSPLRSQRVYHFAAVSALSAVILAALGWTAASGKPSEGPYLPDPCGRQQEAGDMELPSAPNGYCPESLRDPAFHWISEPGSARLTSIGDKIGPALAGGTRSLAIRVSTPAGAVRAVTLDLASRSVEPGSEDCESIEVLRFPWQPPAEEIDLPLTFPLCPGAEMWPGSAEACRKIVIGPADPDRAVGGGGCKSPSRFTLLPLSLAPGGPLLAPGEEGGAALRIKDIAAIETEVWKRYTVGQRIGTALVLVVDPEKGGTLQDLVDLVTMLRWRNVPVADLLWIRGWETSGDPVT